MAITLGDGFVRYGDSSTQNTREQCKMWVRFNGSSGSINDSYGVSSFSKTSTGRYRINYNVTFSSNISTQVSSGYTSGLGQYAVHLENIFSTYMTLICHYIPDNNGNTVGDLSSIFAAAFGTVTE